MSCVVRTCKNIRRFCLGGPHISFHRFPQNDDEFTKWREALQLDESTKWKPSLLVCSDHFDKNDIVIRKQPNNRKTVHYVKYLAIPKLTVPKEQKPSTSIGSTSRTNETLVRPIESPRKAKGETFVLPAGSPAKSPRKKRKLSSSTDSSVDSKRIRKSLF